MKRRKGPGWPIWQLSVFAVAFMVGSLGGCGTVEAPAEEPTIEESVTKEPAAVEEPEAPIPVDRAGRPMLDEEGNPLSIEERNEAADKEE